MILFTFVHCSHAHHTHLLLMLTAHTHYSPFMHTIAHACCRSTCCCSSLLPLSTLCSLPSTITGTNLCSVPISLTLTSTYTTLCLLLTKRHHLLTVAALQQLYMLPNSSLLCLSQSSFPLFTSINYCTAATLCLYTAPMALCMRQHPHHPCSLSAFTTLCLLSFVTITILCNASLSAFTVLACVLHAYSASPSIDIYSSSCMLQL